MKILKIVCVSILMLCVVYAHNTQISVDKTRIVPKLMNYQGYLTDTLGIPVDDTLDMTFKIFDASSAGSELWSEMQTNVPIERGVFSVILGGSTQIPDSVFSDFTNTWLELTLEGPQTLSPRTRITAVGYAYTSTYSDTAEYALAGAADNDWLISGNDQYSGVSGNVGIGVTSPLEKLDVDGAVNTSTSYKIEGYTMLSYINLNNTFVGIGAGENSTTSSKNNTFLGDSAGFSNTSGNNNTFLGHNAGHSNTIGNNTFIGTAAGAFNTTGAKNTFVGFQTGLYNTTGHDNAFSGYEAGLSNASGYCNTFTGTEAGYCDTSGYCNTFTGCGSGYFNVDGFKNTFSGHRAGYSNTIGRHNTFTGNEAGYNNTTGLYNVFSGGETGLNNTTGISNTFIGYGAGYNNTGGDSSVFIGHHAGFNETGSNRLYIANGQNDANVLIYGEFDNQRVGIGTTNPTQELHVQGNARITGALYDSNNETGTSGQVLSTTGSGIDWVNVAADNDWIVSGGIVYPSGNYGLSMRSGNTMYGIHNYTHVDFGVACTTGTTPSYSAYCTVGGGNNNAATGNYTTVSGGTSNSGHGHGATIGGGYDNSTTNDYATVGGGAINSAVYAATVSGGYYNHATGQFAVICGGDHNTATSNYAFAGGGQSNTASGVYSTIGGGQENAATYSHTVVSGGYSNTAGYFYAAVGGGLMNSASGSGAAIAGGIADTASADNSFAANDNSNASHTNSAAFNGQTTTATGQTRVGALSKASGTFTIDHPLDPEHKILNHYFVESPDMSNTYSGSVVLNANGRARVDLPDYFDALNRNPRVQLTGVGSADVVYVAEDFQSNQFTIGGKPGMKVYWTVIADRKDQSAEITRVIMPVEQHKDGDLAGRSLDDEFLCVTMEQLEQMGQAGSFQFRTAAGRNRYEEVKNRVENRQ
jgi:hypothetical protein